MFKPLQSTYIYNIHMHTDLEPDLTVSKAQPFLTRRLWGLEERHFPKWQQEKAALYPHLFH